MKRTTPELNNVWSRALRAALMILPLGLSGCSDDTPPPAGNFGLAVSVSGSGQVTSSPTGIDCGSDCAEAVTSGSTITLSATPASDAMFAGWGGDCSGSTPSCTLTMSAGRAVTASFTFTTDPPPPAAQYNLSVSVTGRGSVSSTPGIACGTDCTESYASGANVTLTTTAEAGFQFSSWGGACSGSSACTVAMSQARSVTATFTPDSASLTVGYNDTTATVTAATVVLDLAQPALSNYPVWVSGVGVSGLIRAATHQVLPGGYFGRGFSRFTPGDFNDGGRGEHYCGIGQIHGFNTVGDSSMMVVGQLIRYGTSYFTDQVAKRPPDGSIKQLILYKNIGGSGSRPMLVTKGPNTSAVTDTKVFAACDGTVCNTTNDITNIDYFNDGNHQPNLDNYLGQWLWVEFAVNTNVPFIRVRTWSADGALVGAETIAPWGAGGQVTHLDVISFVNGIVTLGPQPYFDLERIEFQIGSANNITPPVGFPGSAR